MKILAGLISRQLRLEANKLGHCAVYEKELQRVWPLDDKNRKTKIQQFAKEHGFRLAYYRRGFCAIFEELPPTENITTRITDRHEWIRDKMSRLTPDVQVQQTRSAFRRSAQ